MDEAVEELRRRRERGKLAQRAFREKQNAVVSEMRDENRRLKAAIQDLLKEARPDDRAEVRAAIRKVADIAGLDSRNLDTPSKTDAAPGSCATLGPSLARSRPEIPVPAHNRDFILSQYASTKSVKDISECLPPIVHRASRSSSNSTFDFLGCNISGLFSLYSPPPNPIPPADVVPYIGANEHTLAGQIYWGCFDYIQPLLPQEGHQGLYSVEYLNKLHPILARIFDHYEVMPSVPYMLAMAGARQEFRRLGHCSGGNAAAEVDSGILLRQNIEKHYKAHGENIDAWIEPSFIVEALKALLEPCKLLELEAAVRDVGDVYFKARWEEFRIKLAFSYKCFGDGPRWRSDEVAKTFDEFVRCLTKC